MKTVDEKNFSKENVYRFGKLEWLKEFIETKELPKTNDATNVCIKLNFDDYDENARTHVQLVADKFLKAGFIPEIWIESDKLNLKVSDLDTLIGIEDDLSKNGLELSIHQASNLHTVDETLTAYEKATSFVEFVKSTGASPLEKYLMIYGYVSSFVYKENDENRSSARQLISVLSGNDIVCVGYASLLKYMCEAVGIPCQSQLVTIVDEKTKELSYHQTNTVILKDEKYGVDGAFYADSCWDSILEGKEPFLDYIFALLPVGDLPHVTEILKPENNIYHMFYDVKSYDDLMYNFFSDFSSDPEPMVSYPESFGYKEKFVSAEEIFGSEFGIDEAVGKHAAKRFIELLDEYGIPDDAYRKLNGAPEYLNVNFLLALCIDSPRTDGLLHHYMKKLKQIVSEGTFEKNPEGMCVLTDADKLKNLRENIGSYFYLNDKELDEECAVVIWDTSIRNYYANLKYYERFRDYLNHLKEGSKPIDLEKFKQALLASFEASGMEKKEALNIVSRAIEHCVKRSEKNFDDGASNSFRVQAARNRMMQNS